MRTIKATFSIQEDSDLVGVKFYGEKGKVIQWEDLSKMEQTRMLNSWAQFHGLFIEHLKK